jgi:hypothetical protein
MSNRPGPKPVILQLGEHPVLDRWVVPCSCAHEYDDHTRYGNACKGNDSYGCRCECPEYDADENYYVDRPGHELRKTRKGPQCSCGAPFWPCSESSPL